MFKNVASKNVPLPHLGYKKDFPQKMGSIAFTSLLKPNFRKTIKKQ